MYGTQLKLSGCTEDEFTCNNGQCIPMTHRCNKVADCNDKSDERKCKTVVLDEGYNKAVPPFSIDNFNLKNKLHVKVCLNIFNMEELDGKKTEFKIFYEMKSNWYENRAQYHNLKTNDEMNALTKEEK